MNRARAMASAICLLSVGASDCAPAHPRAVAENAAAESAVSSPIIDSIRPDSVAVPYGAAVNVTIYGKGFVGGKPGRNTVHFDRATFGAIAASADGGRIDFTIPNEINSGGEAPPMKLQSGSYSIGVETPAGLSNLVSIRVYR